ncbi:hypothetical protein [Actinomadura luteofluorescens]|uniref:hypothetical protein n=1 Tax=Actinomadura luteofluorescens TaxID=46163 RepID=UPI003D8E3753
MDTTPLRDAYRALLEAAATVADAGDSRLVRPAGEWNADQILAHLTIVNAVTVAAAGTITAGANTTYDNRVALDTWTIDRVIARAGGNAALRDRIAAQAEIVCALGEMVSEPELDTLVPTLLVSNDMVVIDQPMSLKDLFNGLAEGELPGHSHQLLALLPDDTGSANTRPPVVPARP